MCVLNGQNWKFQKLTFKKYILINNFIIMCVLIVHFWKVN